jgi:ubiquinone/menaquinone biosynthesis C-methylase UbiE
MLAMGAAGQSRHQHHPPRSAEEYARVLNDPERDAWQKPHETVTALGLRPTEAVADIGAGTGYFSRRFARHAGRAIAVDIDQKLLDLAAKDAPANHETLLATPSDPKLAPASVDTLFFCDVLHHIDNRPAYLAKLLPALKPGGRLVLIDFHKRPTPVGPGLDMRISEEQAVAEMTAAGLKLARRESFLPYQYFLFFERQ